jgi:hypothetical protein
MTTIQEIIKLYVGSSPEREREKERERARDYMW